MLMQLQIFNTNAFEICRVLCWTKNTPEVWGYRCTFPTPFPFFLAHKKILCE